MARSDLKQTVKVAFATGTEELNDKLIARLKEILPELPLVVVSEFPWGEGRWIPYHPLQGFWVNLRRCRAALRGSRIRLAGVMLVPKVPYRRLRLIALVLAPVAFMAFNENLDHWMLRPRCVPLMLRHLAWRLRNLIVFETHPGGHLYTWLWRLVRPREWRRPLAWLGGQLAGLVAAALKALLPPQGAVRLMPPLAGGISVIIPSRNGKQLLERMLPGVLEQLRGWPAEVLVIDNGSDDGTAEFLSEKFPQVICDQSPAPLGFAQAVNRGLKRARFSHVCLLNNDMVLRPGFFQALRRAFDEVPDLFCATAQILFPEGARRQETGKAVMPPQHLRQPADFPVRCELPLPSEDLSYVLYGSGGCSMYDAAKLRALGGFDEAYHPAYVEDLDVGYRAWLQGWPTVFVAGACVVHEHRMTTSRYYSETELETFLEVNYLRFLARAVRSPAMFRRLWAEAIKRLNWRAAYGQIPAMRGLQQAWQAPLWLRRPLSRGPFSDELVLGVGSGVSAVFPGRARHGGPVVLIASPYPPFPLSHGGAVRMYNLMRRLAGVYKLVLACFVDELSPPADELLDLCAEVVFVRRPGTHLRPLSRRPDMVEEHDTPAFRAALRQTARKWRPGILQLEFTHMAQYRNEAGAARTILVEHDVTVDLYRQLAEQQRDWEAQRQLVRWMRFEKAAWRQVDCVVVMSARDRELVQGARHVVCLPNGVDLERFRPAEVQPDPRRLLFIGSFAHLPNILAMDFFLREVWPHLSDLGLTLHIIAGLNHRAYLERYREHAIVDLEQPAIETEDFVADPRPAYARAAIVIAPLVASAGTNIKVLEAMAMGKAIVSTPAGIHGLEVTPGEELLVASGAREFATAIRCLVNDPALRRRLECRARARVERDYGWDAIAERQKQLYQELMTRGSGACRQALKK